MTMPSERPFGFIQSRAENRRASKPLMEKRRRARINHSLSQLKALLLDASAKKESQNSRHSKLEKADILEMTVKHLQALHRQNVSASPSDAAEAAKYRAGFAECIREVSRFIYKPEAKVEPQTRSQLLSHLAANLAALAPSAEESQESTSDSASGHFPVMQKAGSSVAPEDRISQKSSQSSVLPSYITRPVKVEIPDAQYQSLISPERCSSVVARPSPLQDFASVSSCPGSPLNLATVSRSASSSSGSSRSTTASPFSDTDSTVSTNEEFRDLRLDDSKICSVIRRAPALNDPVWRPW